MKNQNYIVKDLGIKDGFPPDVPEDADAVIITGAKKTFTLKEQKALKDYLFSKNGRILLSLDPKLSANFSFILDPFRIRYKREKLLSELSVKGNSDIIIMGNYKEHPITNPFINQPPRQRVSIFPRNRLL